MSDVELVSPLSPDQCLARLREATSWMPFGTRPLYGLVFHQVARVSTKKGMGNPHQPMLVGRFLPHEGGAVLRGTIHANTLRSGIGRLGPFVGILFAAILSVFCVRSFLRLILAGEDLSGVLVSLLMTAMAVGFVMLTTWRQRLELRSGQDECRYLLELVAAAIGSPSTPDRHRGGAWSGTRDWFERRQETKGIRGWIDLFSFGGEEPTATRSL